MRSVICSRPIAVCALLAGLSLSTSPLRAGTHIHRGTPTLDGIETPGEWTGAEAGSAPLTLPVTFGGSTSEVTFYAMSDDTFFYAAVRVPVSSSPDSPGLVGLIALAHADSVDPCGEPVLIDDFEIYSYENAAHLVDSYWTGCVADPALDEGDGGATNTGGTWAISSMSHFFEIAQPLDAGDDLHDISASVPGFLNLNLITGASDGDDQGVLAQIYFRMFLSTADSIFFANLETGDTSEWTIVIP